MHRKLAPFFTVIAIGFTALSASGQATSLNTVPEGMVTINLAATGSGSSTSYVSLPLTADPSYTGAVSAVTTNTIMVADSPAPWTAGALSTAAAPYFVKFLTGTEAGRVLKITANTTNTLTLDTTDNSSQTVSLTTSGFAVTAGGSTPDTFEVFPGDTLGSVFGATSGSLLLVGAGSILSADTISIYNPALLKFQAYYFNTTAGFWELSGSTANANNTILYPYGSLTILRRPNEAALSISLMGRVAEVAVLTKTTGSGAAIYSSTGYPADVTLANLQLGSNWIKGSSPLSADTLSVWDPSLNKFDAYYQLSTDSTWRKSGNTSTDQSSFVLPAGSGFSILQRGTVSGQSSFLQSVLPYTLN